MAQTLQKIYAQAVFELCCEQDNLSDIYGEITQIDSLLQENYDFVKILSSPSISVEEKRKILHDVFEGRVSDIVFNFLSVVVEKGRIDYFDKIAQEIKSLYFDKCNILEVSVTTAQPLSNELKARLKSKLEKISQKTVILDEKLDEKIIGGIVVKYGNTQIDGSVKHKLDTLREQIDSIIA